MNPSLIWFGPIPRVTPPLENRFYFGSNPDQSFGSQSLIGCHVEERGRNGGLGIANETVRDPNGFVGAGSEETHGIVFHHRIASLLRDEGQKCKFHKSLAVHDKSR